jgi:hypothetical protein
MAAIPVEQALFLRQENGPPLLRARSAGFQDTWQPEVEELLAGFGDRPAGVACPSAVFAQPLGKQNVAVVHVADQDPDPHGRPRALGFHVLVLPRDAYVRFLGDPFLVSERALPAWDDPGPLPSLSWPADPLPRRSVREVQAVLQRIKQGALRENEEVPEAPAEPVPAEDRAEGPALLGGVQVLVDGGKLVFERPGPDTGLLRALWTLLPNSTRSHLWPASFAFSNALEFDALVVPRAPAEAYPGYTTEDQAADYPEGRYELALQTAAEAGDQQELDLLLSRRSWHETWRLGITVLVLFTLLALAARVLEFSPRAPEGPPASPGVQQKQAIIAASVVGVSEPWSQIALLPAARQAWNELRKQAPP